MGKPTLRIYPPSELGGYEKIRVEDLGKPIILAQGNLQKLMNKAGATTNIGSLGPGTLGAYYPSKKLVVLDKKLMNIETAHHEGAHGLDHKNDWLSRKEENPFKVGGKNTPEKEWGKVLVARFNGFTVTKDHIKTLPALKRRVSGSFFNYMNGADERFAAGYGQWKMNPGKFATYAPTIASWFRANAKGL